MTLPAPPPRLKPSLSLALSSVLVLGFSSFSVLAPSFSSRRFPGRHANLPTPRPRLYQSFDGQIRGRCVRKSTDLLEIKDGTVERQQQI